MFAREIRASGFLLLLALAAPRATPAHADPARTPAARSLAAARAVERELVRAVRRVQAAAVTVVGRRMPRGRGSDSTLRPLPLGGVGSGVVVEWRGTWVVTNYHVVDDEGRIEVITGDGRRHPVRVRAASRQVDLALLSFERRPEGIRGADLSRGTSDALQQGSWVVATGNPFFLALDGRAAATLGVFAGMRPADSGGYIDAPTLQHDAEINPGSSGGAVWSARGELLGINGIIATHSRAQGAAPAHTGASFSVPVAAVRRFLTSALGPVRPAPRVVAARGSLGARFRTSRSRTGQPVGAVVTAVGGPRPATTSGMQGGLRPGDLVTQFAVGGRAYPIRTAADVERVLVGLPPGTAVSVAFRRAGRSYAWTGRLAGS